MPPNGVGRLLWQCPWVGEEGTQCTGGGRSPEEVLIIQDTTPSWQQEGKQITCRMWACEGWQMQTPFSSCFLSGRGSRVLRGGWV